MFDMPHYLTTTSDKSTEIASAAATTSLHRLLPGSKSRHTSGRSAYIPHETRLKSEPRSAEHTHALCPANGPVTCCFHAVFVP